MRKRSDVTKYVILTAARYLFLNQGYAKTTIDAIALQAQVTKRTVYNYFPDKRSLFKGVIVESVGDPWEFRQILEAIETAFDLQIILIQIATGLNEVVAQPDYLRFQRLVISEIPTQPDLRVLLESGAIHRAYNATLDVITIAHKRDILTIKDIEAAARRFVGGFLVSVYFDGLLRVEPMVQKQNAQKITVYVEDFLISATKPD